jgi:hypothetical protein
MPLQYHMVARMNTVFLEMLSNRSRSLRCDKRGDHLFSSSKNISYYRNVRHILRDSMMHPVAQRVARTTHCLVCERPNLMCPLFRD